jgi:unsaturated rhamnogalacturonyl hydrolase
MPPSPVTTSMKSYLLRFALLLLLSVHAALPARAATRDDVLALMRRVCDRELAEPHRPDNWQRDRLNSWIPSAFYPGVLACYYATQDRKYLQAAINWAKLNRWEPASRFRHADDLLCCQTYLEIYEVVGDKAMIAPTIARFDAIMTEPQPGQLDWSWCDSLFMAPPAWARLGKVTGDDRYYAFLYKQYWEAADFLRDRETGFFYRDKNFFARRTAGGQKIFWSRGNGWVIAGLARILDYLPKKDAAQIERFRTLYRSLAKNLKERQGTDGLWRMSLLDPAEFPQKETSGTAFFCYALLKGINEGWLPADDFLPAARRAWAGLTDCVDETGILRCVQPGGAAPAAFKAELSHSYAAGAFLLAGREVVRFIDAHRGTDF